MWDTPTFCARCCRSFNRAVDKNKHVENSASHNVCTMCSHCPDFLAFYQLQQHRKDKHVLCGWCSRYFRDAAVFANHKEGEHFFCNWCSVWFRNRYALDVHNDQDHSRCSVCDLLFENANNRQMVWLYSTVKTEGI